MPSAPLLRKRLLQALENHLIPTLQTPGSSRMILGELPLFAPDEISVRALPIPLLRVSKAQPSLIKAWPKHRMNSGPWPYLIGVFEGEADLRVGTTTAMARAWKKQNPGFQNDLSLGVTGCHVLSLPATSFVLFPPGVPYSDGSRPPWERDSPPHSRLFITHFLSDGILCHLHDSHGTQHLSEHSLLVKDRQLGVLGELFADELRTRSPNFQSLAQAYLLAIMTRIQRRLNNDPPTIGNTAWNSFVIEEDASVYQQERVLTTEIPGDLHEYIRTHLREPLTLQRLARQARMSPTHLNRLFQAKLGLTVMRYVTQRRMAAAKMMLSGNLSLSIQEIGYLVGYTHASHFCNIFRQHTGMSPGEFRAAVQKGASNRDVDNLQ
jgi:AraC-like DNA-binding protein